MQDICTDVVVAVLCALIASIFGVELRHLTGM